MKVQVSRWGNSLAVRIPSKAAQSLGVVEGTVAELTVRGDQMTIRPTRAYRLKDLLAGITKENLHGEVNTGRPRGAEVVR
jgi:antitoxin MazE